MAADDIDPDAEKAQPLTDEDLQEVAGGLAGPEGALPGEALLGEAGLGEAGLGEAGLA